MRREERAKTFLSLFLSLFLSNRINSLPPKLSYPAESTTYRPNFPIPLFLSSRINDLPEQNFPIPSELMESTSSSQNFPIADREVFSGRFLLVPAGGWMDDGANARRSAAQALLAYPGSVPIRTRPRPLLRSAIRQQSFP